MCREIRFSLGFFGHHDLVDLCHDILYYIAPDSVMIGLRGLSYWIKGNLFISVTNELNSVSRFALRGPSYVPPTGFQKLADNAEPTSEVIFKLVDEAFEEGKIAMSSMDAAPVTFEGYGEPLLRAELVCEAADMIKEARHGVPLHLVTNGLVNQSSSGDMIQKLKASGISKVIVSLLTDNPKQYNEIMCPRDGTSFGDVCSFVTGCVENDLEVECTTVAIPGINVRSVRGLAFALGAQDFQVLDYHP